MNIVYLMDAVVAIIIIFCAFSGYKKGFLKATLTFLPMAVALVTTYFLSPLAGKFLRTLPLYTNLNHKIYDGLGLENFVKMQSESIQGDFFAQMHLPKFLENSLVENNNPVAYDILNVDKIQDYIASYFANMCLNIISVIVVFVLVFIICKIFMSALNLVFNLPILSFFNRLCGLIVGTIQGVGIVWLLGIMMTFFYSNVKFKPFFEVLNMSSIASVFYENNLLLLLILKIFT